jgi:hypothetical protein
MPVPKETTAAGRFPIASPQVQGLARLRGADVGRANHGTVIDGAQFRRKF